MGSMKDEWFPKDPQKRNLWIISTRRENWAPTKHTCLCSQHFEERYIDRTSKNSIRLRDNAVPTIFPYLQKIEIAELVGDNDVEIKMETSAESDADNSQDELTAVNSHSDVKIETETLVESCINNLIISANSANAKGTQTHMIMDHVRILKAKIRTLQQKVRRQQLKIENMKSLILVLKPNSQSVQNQNNIITGTTCEKCGQISFT